jgi:hypothetical protein
MLPLFRNWPIPLPKCRIIRHNSRCLTLGTRRESLIRVQKRSQLFIATHNQTLSVPAMCVSKEDRGAMTI